MNPGETVRRVRAWHLCLAVAPLVIGSYYLLLHLGTAPGLQVALYVSANGSLAVTALIAARRHPALRAVMFLLAASAVAAVLGDILYVAG